MTVSFRTTRARAAAVSRFLAQHNLRPLPASASYYREGIRVKHIFDGKVRITVDLDNTRERDLLRSEIVKVLEASAYTVERHEHVLIVDRSSWVLADAR